MNKLFHFAAIGAGLLTVLSCGVSKSGQEVTYAPQEAGLNVTRISNNEKNSVYGQTTAAGRLVNGPSTTRGYSKKGNISWTTQKTLDASPNTNEIVYLSMINKQVNAVICDYTRSSGITQRTFKNVNDITWGVDDKLYFTTVPEVNGRNNILITGAHSGTMVRQLTSSFNDGSGSLSDDGELYFFERFDGGDSPIIWSVNTSTGALTSCARGYNPVAIPGDPNKFLCVRNDENSEIWLIDYVNGIETLLLSADDRGFTNPAVSPDGRWVLVEGNSKSDVSKKQNLDIFVVGIDGSSFTQLTYHQATDICPTWSYDGKYVFFISDRSNKDKKYNVWRMDFPYKELAK